MARAVISWVCTLACPDCVRSFAITVAVKAPAASRASFRCPHARKTLTKSLSRLKGRKWPFFERTARLLPISTSSLVVNTAPHAVQLRRRQTCISRFWGRELETCVLPPQYIQTMSTYCHTAIDLASGKQGKKRGKRKTESFRFRSTYFY